VGDDGVLRQRVLGHPLDEGAAEGEEVARAEKEVPGAVPLQTHPMGGVRQQVRPVTEWGRARADTDGTPADRAHRRFVEGRQQRSERVCSSDDVPITEDDHLPPGFLEPAVECCRLSPTGVGDVAYGGLLLRVTFDDGGRLRIGADDQQFGSRRQLGQEGLDGVAHRLGLAEGGDQEGQHGCVGCQAPLNRNLRKLSQSSWDNFGIIWEKLSINSLPISRSAP
jgi:hypothetical protein